MQAVKKGKVIVMGNAVGIVEVYGLVAAFVAGDAGCKVANVTIESFDRNKPANSDKLPVPLIVVVKFRGSVDAVKAAVDAAEAAANQVSGVIVKHVIAAPDEGIEKMLEISGLDKN